MELDLANKEMNLNFEKERMKLKQKIKELETENASVNVFVKRYEEERRQNRDLERNNHEVIMKMNDLRIELEKTKDLRKKEIDSVKSEYERKIDESKYMNESVNIKFSIIKNKKR